MSLAAFDAAQAAEHLELSEKMMRKLRAGHDAARGRAPAGRGRAHGARGGARDARRSRRAGESQSRVAAVPAPQPRRVRARGERHARHRHRRRGAAAGRHHQQRFRQRRRLAGVLARRCSRVTCAPRRRVTALAIGDPEAAATETNYRVPKTASQLARVDGAPFGTRGGVSTPHNFPADGDYVFKVELHSNACGVLFGGRTTAKRSKCPSTASGRGS